ncbi:uncharacterized protein LOC119546832 [Drosophila subpulchrella]|uniref:uncharacterized protein LOC119546832 n=1 Tax=Drosophila subpulchrella TaxID=1486046 RepID=UPI0018A19844|nr:uncharacterized protein LOC119546832 [Drosophila subpulchrella]
MDEGKDRIETDSSSDLFNIQFPLPQHLDPSQCRDEFLAMIIEEHERRVSSLKRSTARFTAASLYPMDTEYRLSEKGAEAMVVRQLATQRQRRIGKKTVEEVMESIKMRSNMMAELNIQCQKAAIEFLSVRLLKQLRLFSSPWPGKLDDMPYNLFSWSLEHFLLRLDHNQMYLDVINRERSSEDLDCLKFRADLNEIEQIIYDIREDFQRNEDLCESSIKLIRDCKYNTNGAWIKDLQVNSLLKENLSRDSPKDDSTHVHLHKRQSMIMGRFEDVSALDPIEVRYQINWVNSCMDQRLILLKDREDKLQEELKDWETKLSQDQLVQHNSEVVYAWEVDKLKMSCKEWQVKLDTDLENIEVLCTISRLALQKVKDDHKFLLEQEEMFRRRIAEETELMATEEKIRQQKQVKSSDVKAAVEAIEAVFKPSEPNKKAAKF